MDEDLDYVRFRVAEKLGWKSIEYNRDGFLVGYAPGYRKISVIPSFARDLRSAWLLADYLSAFEMSVHLGSNCHQGFRSFSVDIKHPHYSLIQVQAEDAALALCKAFLLVPKENLSTSTNHQPIATSGRTWHH